MTAVKYRYWHGNKLMFKLNVGLNENYRDMIYSGFSLFILDTLRSGDNHRQIFEVVPVEWAILHDVVSN